MLLEELEGRTGPNYDNIGIFHLGHFLSDDELTVDSGNQVEQRAYRRCGNKSQ